MDDTAVVWTLGGVLILLGLIALTLAIVATAGWAVKCGVGGTTCNCEDETVPPQCNYQCWAAKTCGCEDLEDMKASRDNLNKWVEKKKGEGTGSSGSSGGTNGDGGTGQRDWSTGGKIAGLTDKGEIWIAESVFDNHCQGVVDSIYRHEQVHQGDDTCRNPLTFAGGTLGTMVDGNYVQNLHDKSEFSAYGTQIAYLETKIAALEVTCNAEYRCSYSGEVFDDRFDCIDACPCSLAHPCAGIPPCIQQNKETGEATGLRF